jgi:HK97 gp10 family phage protein
MAVTNTKNYKSNVKRVKYVLDECEKAALREIGKITAATIRKRAPKKKKGLIKKNIRYELRYKMKGVRIGVRSGKGGLWPYYARFVELGHRIVPKTSAGGKVATEYFRTFTRGARKGQGYIRRYVGPGFKRRLEKWSGAMVKPYPWFMPAVDSIKTQLQDLVKKHLRRMNNNV